MLNLPLISCIACPCFPSYELCDGYAMHESYGDCVICLHFETIQIFPPVLFFSFLNFLDLIKWSWVVVLSSLMRALFYFMVFSVSGSSWVSRYHIFGLTVWMKLYPRRLIIKILGGIVVWYVRGVEGLSSQYGMKRICSQQDVMLLSSCELKMGIGSLGPAAAPIKHSYKSLCVGRCRRCQQGNDKWRKRAIQGKEQFNFGQWGKWCW